eukprot:CAMPEP_0179337976 /NCGR_PEP_ID=MMETSP0797-20121207/67930_1 /TAXON_ID=47934 /ORGANISM="Dinophysis acuminata, Strain DAEP01" /LENGTH=625 /DNA_ID=CAMNT_0021051699 /DNA_START=95 /DNA_END=1972 /DNA_ORIENTATION=-
MKGLRSPEGADTAEVMGVKMGEMMDEMLVAISAGSEERPPPAGGCGREPAAETGPAPATKASVDWLHEYDSIEREEEEVRSSQSRLLRQEMKKLVCDLALVQRSLDEFRHSSGRALDELKHSSGRALSELRSSFDRWEVESREEQALRLESSEHLMLEVRRFREDVRLEAEERKAGDQAVLSEMRSLVGSVTEMVEFRHGDQADSIMRLRGTVDDLLPRLSALSDGITQEARDREASETSIMNVICEHRRGFARELQSCSAGHQELQQALRAAAEEHRHVDLQPLRDKVDKSSEELAALRRQCEELEESVAPRLGEHGRALERLCKEQATDRTWLEQRVGDFTCKLKDESAARTMFVDEVEQLMMSFRLKLRSLGSQQSEELRGAREALQSEFHSRAKPADGGAGRRQQSEELRDINLRCDELRGRVAGVEASVASIDRALRAEREESINGFVDGLQRRSDMTPQRTTCGGGGPFQTPDGRPGGSAAAKVRERPLQSMPDRPAVPRGTPEGEQPENQPGSEGLTWWRTPRPDTVDTPDRVGAELAVILARRRARSEKPLGVRSSTLWFDLADEEGIEKFPSSLQSLAALGVEDGGGAGCSPAKPPGTPAPAETRTCLTRAEGDGE